jgi:D-sedoheptulose 7-phosphate isomerase
MEKRIIQEIFDEHVFLARRFLERSSEQLDRALGLLLRTLREGNKILVLGNGGSAADAQHIASELVGRFQKERPGLAAIALTTDASTLTSVANDYGFESVFSRQVDALGKKGDALIAISTSGASRNVIEALRSARSRGIATVGLLGRDGGAARELCDVALVVDGQKTARIQEVHILIAHVICEHLESEMC